LPAQSVRKPALCIKAHYFSHPFVISRVENLNIQIDRRPPERQPLGLLQNVGDFVDRAFDAPAGDKVIVVVSHKQAPPAIIRIRTAPPFQISFFQAEVDD
jgi:hypothetical protein